MRNILLYSYFCPNNLSGGVEHVTLSLHKILIANNFNCHVIFEQYAGETSSYQFIKLPEDNTIEYISKLITEHEIEAIIIQGNRQFIATANNVKALINRHLRIIYVNHGDPFYEFSTVNINTYCFYYSNSKGLKSLRALSKMLFFPIFKVLKTHKYKKTERELQKYVDYIVFISENSAKEYNKFFKNRLYCKIGYANNPLSYSVSEDIISNLQLKEKCVIYVGRMEEYTKKISLVLQIWRIISNNAKYDDWKLYILGDGPDKKDLEKYALKIGCKHVSFLGHCDPLDFYKRAPILMFTSISEGWGLTITEAMQNGCIPIVFKSYPASSDIINNNQNGLLIDYPNISQYVDKLELLINNKNMRVMMANNAIQYLKRFNDKNIYNQWQNIFNKL